MQPTVLIKKELLDVANIEYFPSDQSFLNQVTKKLILKANQKNTTILNQSSAPTLKPNPNLGEGKASKEETEFRQDLLDFLEPILDKFNEIVNDSSDVTDKISTIDSLIDTFTSSAQHLVTTTITERYNDGYEKMNGYIAKKTTPPTKSDNQPRLQSLLRQQTQNIEDIGLRLRGRLRQILNMQDVQSYYHKSTPVLEQSLTLAQAITPVPNWTQCMKDTHKLYPDMSEADLKEYCEDQTNSINSAFNNAQNSLDMLGMFGWLESFQDGYLSAGMLAITLISTLSIKLPWLTCEDNGNCSSDTPVCEDCNDLKADGPYSVDKFPDEPHDLCRCNDPPAAPVITFG